MTIRILLVDDHQIVCDGLRLVLEQQSGMEVVGVAHDGRHGVRLAQELRPDVVILDVAMPDLNGLEAARQLLEQQPQLRIVALSMHSDRRYVAGMLEAGAQGYLLKDCAAEELADAIRTVVGGRVYLSPSVSGQVVEALRQRNLEQAGPAARLTPREREVLQLLAEGHATRRIAQRLHLSVKTVETHRRQLMEKLDLHSVADLTRYALREGITTLDR